MTDLQWAFVAVAFLAVFGWWFAATEREDKIQARHALRAERTLNNGLVKTVQIQSRTITDLKRRRAEQVGVVDRAG